MAPWLAPRSSRSAWWAWRSSSSVIWCRSWARAVRLASVSAGRRVHSPRSATSCSCWVTAAIVDVTGCCPVSSNAVVIQGILASATDNPGPGMRHSGQLWRSIFESFWSRQQCGLDTRSLALCSTIGGTTGESRCLTSHRGSTTGDNSTRWCQQLLTTTGSRESVSGDGREGPRLLHLRGAVRAPHPGPGEEHRSDHRDRERRSRSRSRRRRRPGRLPSRPPRRRRRGRTRCSRHRGPSTPARRCRSGPTGRRRRRRPW